MMVRQAHIQKGWEYKKLGDAMHIARGGSPRPIKQYLTDDPNGLNWIKIGDATESNKYIYKTKEKITKDGLHKTRFVEEGDFLLSNSMSFGRPYIMKTTGCIHDGWLVLKEIEDIDLDKDFLYHLLCSPYLFEQFDKLAAGSTVRNLNIALVSSVEIPIPPLDEQKRIVAKLDECFDAIDKARANVEKNLNNAKELFQSQLNQIFSQKGDGWVEKKLGEVCSVTSKLIDPKQPEYLNLLHIGGGNIVAETGELVGLKTSKDEKLKSGKFSFDDSMVLYNKIRPYLIKVVRPSFKGLCSADMYPLSPNTDEISRDYLYFLLVSKKFTDYAISGSARSGMPKVNRKHLFEFQCSFPSKYEQNNIIEQLDALKSQTQSLESNYQQELAALDELKKSILQKAFMGEL
jgi:type I restriction enzyme S subunit